MSCQAGEEHLLPEKHCCPASGSQDDPALAQSRVLWNLISEERQTLGTAQSSPICLAKNACALTYCSVRLPDQRLLSLESIAIPLILRIKHQWQYIIHRIWMWRDVRLSQLHGSLQKISMHTSRCYPRRAGKLCLIIYRSYSFGNWLSGQIFEKEHSVLQSHMVGDSA